MSRTVRGLEERGLVDREPDPRDGRAVRLTASPAGRAILEEGKDRRLRQLRRSLDGLSDAEARRVGEALALLERLLP